MNTTIGISGPGSDRAPTKFTYGTGRAHGKVVLLGEHAVIHGAPALVFPVPQLTVSATACRSESPEKLLPVATAGQRAQWSDPSAQALISRFAADFPSARNDVVLYLDSTIPHGRGLGSSAAHARAAVGALAELFAVDIDAQHAYELVQVAERWAHGAPSGVDAAATGSATPIIFQRGTSRPVAGSNGLLVVADSGQTGSTRDAIGKVTDQLTTTPATVAAFVTRVTELISAAVEDLARENLAELGAKMVENHRLLQALNLSTPPLEKLISAARAAGAVGAKLTGGGLGGCIVALATDAHVAQDVTTELKAAGAVDVWTVSMQPGGKRDR